MAKKKTDESLLDLPVAFGNVSIGDKTARLGVSVDRADLALARAGSNLCGRRLTGTILARHNGADAEQSPLPGMEDVDRRISGVFDVQAFRCSPKLIAFGLTFSLDRLDVSELAHFAKANGKLIVESVEDLPEDSDDEE